MDIHITDTVQQVFQTANVESVGIFISQTRVKLTEKHDNFTS